MTAHQQFELTSHGAGRVRHCGDALLIAYLDATGGYLGQPELIEDGKLGSAGE